MHVPQNSNGKSWKLFGFRGQLKTGPKQLVVAVATAAAAAAAQPQEATTGWPQPCGGRGIWPGSALDQRDDPSHARRSSPRRLRPCFPGRNKTNTMELIRQRCGNSCCRPQPQLVGRCTSWCQGRRIQDLLNSYRLARMAYALIHNKLQWPADSASVDAAQILSHY